MSVFVHTNPLSSGSQYANSAATTLPFPSAFPPDFFPVVTGLLHGIYQPSYRYRRAGVYLGSIGPQEVVQQDLFGAFSLSRFLVLRHLLGYRMWYN